MIKTVLIFTSLGLFSFFAHHSFCSFQPPWFKRVGFLSAVRVHIFIRLIPY